MPFQERSAVVSLFSALIVGALYYFYVSGLYQAGRFDGPEAGALVGRSVFIMIGVGILVRIGVQIVFSIVHAIATKEAEDGVTDERDKLIELKAMQIAFVSFSFGFLALMGILALSMLVPYMVILLTIACMYAASVIADVVKLVLYRRGL